MLGILLGFPGPVRGQAPEVILRPVTSEELNNPAFVPKPKTDGLLRTLVDLLQKEKSGVVAPSKLLTEYLKVIRTAGDDLCPLQSTPHYTGYVQRFLNVRQYCQERVAGLPLQARDQYAEHIRTRAGTSLTERDPARLDKLAREFGRTPEAAQALSAAAHIFFERGQLDSAVERWQALLARNPDFLRSRPDLFGRLIVSLIRLGRLTDLEFLAARLGRDFPDLSIGAKPLSLARFAANAVSHLAQAFRNEPGRFCHRTGLGGGMLGYALAPPLGVIGERPLAFQNDLAMEERSGSFYRFAPPLTTARLDGGPFCPIFPAAAWGDVLVSFGYGLFPLDPSTGKRDGPRALTDARLLRDSVLASQPMEATGAPVHRKRLICDPVHGLWVSRDRVYVVVNKYFKADRHRNRRHRFANGLFALDRGFRILWSRGEVGDRVLDEHDLDPETDPFLASVHFHSHPVEHAGRLFVGATRFEADSAQTFLLCFDRKGRQLWRTFLSHRRIPRNAADFLLESGPPLCAEGLVFINTNAGTIAAVQPDTGDLVWIVKYRVPAYDQRTDGEYHRYLFWRPNPLLYAGGVLFATPQETFRLLALQPRTGQIHWMKPDPRVVASTEEWERLVKDRKKNKGLPDPRVFHLLGASRGLLLVTTLTGVYAYEASALGAGLRWRSSFLGPLLGRGVLTRDRVLCPTTHGVESFAVADGRRGTTLAWTKVRRAYREIVAKEYPKDDPSELGRSGTNIMAFTAPSPVYCPHGGETLDDGSCAQRLPVERLRRDAEVVCPRCGRSVKVKFHTYLFVVTRKRFFTLPAGSPGKVD
jgi:hypothetical protein